MLTERKMWQIAQL